MKRSWLLWTLFTLCLALALSAMAWISATVLRLDRAEAEARRAAAVEESVRLALWRMDSALAPLIAQETARPYFAYQSFTPAERAYTRMFNELRYGDVLVPSPLLSAESNFVRVHFQYSPDGTLSSPQAPTGNMLDLSLGREYTSRARVDAAQAALDDLRGRISQQQLLAILPAATAPPQIAANPNFFQLYNDDSAVIFNGIEQQQQELNANPPGQQMAQADQQVKQYQRSKLELQKRAVNSAQASNFEFANRGNDNVKGARAPDVREGVMRPMWIGEALVLARRVSIDGQSYVQGCWLNWEQIRTTLLASASDLLPHAQLDPVRHVGNGDAQTRLLASIPVRLDPGHVPVDAVSTVSPIRMSLLLAWIGLVLGMGAVGALLGFSLRLSERRGAFVSAVTHELRTPLTTVSMYAEMLEGGMVSDEAARAKYLGTLRAEADRLGHLVENVLAYSRIERGNIAARLQDVPLPQLIESVQRRLQQRADQAGMTLRISLSTDVTVRADPSAVEQILFNLVDNACKYGRNGDGGQIDISAQSSNGSARIHIHDSGPGISAADARKLFRPFSKSARDAANSAPGVGLGLALSRRLARQMKGDLSLTPCEHGGACFILDLPAV